MPTKPKRRKNAARPAPRPQPLIHRPHPQTELNVEHSTQLVQTAVAAIFFEIIWVRKVFQDHAWQHRNYHPDDPSNSYDAYVEGTNFKLPFPNEIYDWHVPKRGEDDRVDKLMDCLESCAKGPIEKGYLQKLQLCFHTVDDKKVSENNLIESYSLTFKYENGKTTSQLSRQIRDAQTEKINTLVLSEGRKKFIDMANELFQCIYKSDRHGRLKQYPLPAQFRMNLLAEYNDSAPSGYQPPYFKAGDAATIALLSLCHSDDRFTMNTGYHEVSAGVLLPGSADSPVRSQEKPVLVSNVKSSSHINALPHSVNRTDSNQPSLQNTRSVRLRSIAGDGETQRSAVCQLKNMVGFSRVPNSATQDTQRLEQNFVSLAHQFMEAQQEFSTEVNAPPYTQYILDRLNKRLFERAGASRGDDLDEPQGIGHDDDHYVSCECECPDDSGNMLYCVECQQLQHSACYGYLDDQQFSNHLCYTCLSILYPEEEQQLIAAASLCVQRLTLRFLQNKHAPVFFQEFADYLGRSLELTDEVIKALEGTKLVRKFNLTEDLPHQQVKYVGNDDALRELYFRPQRFINNLFAIPEASLSNNILKPEDTTGGNGAACSTNNACTVVDPSQRPFYDDSTTQGEPSPQSSTRQTPRPLDTYHLQNIARNSLEFNPHENVTPATKRSGEVGSPVGAVKRARTSRTSPMLF